MFVIKKYTIEGVQFHPESILTEEGHRMIKNILNIRGGYWNDNENCTIFTDKEVKSSTTKKLKLQFLMKFMLKELWMLKNCRKYLVSHLMI